MRPTQIISGGQTGADIGGLAAARKLGIATGGTAPKGWRTEKGPQPILAQYGLVESVSPDYSVRTRQNVVDADATVIVCRVTLDGGSALTAHYAQELGKPWIWVDPWLPGAESAVRAFLARHRPRVLNVAGNRESKAPGIARATVGLLLAALGSDTPGLSEGEPAPGPDSKFWMDTGWACGLIVVRDGLVVDGAPIFRRLFGQSSKNLERYRLRKIEEDEALIG